MPNQWTKQADDFAAARLAILAYFKSDERHYNLSEELLRALISGAYIDGAADAVKTCDALGHNHSQAVPHD